MRKTLIAAALASAFASSVATAELSYNVGVSSEYSYRGISQSANDPALSGGIDFSHESGLYLGTWASTISWLEDGGLYSDSNVEVDVYGGFKFDLAPIGLDVGVLRYIYPGDVVPGNLKADTTEVYVAGSYEMLTVKYSHSTTNLFGVADSKKSGYLEANASFEIVDGYKLDLHVGQQTIKNVTPDDNYVDYKVGVSKDFGFMAGSLAVVGTDIDKTGVAAFDDTIEDRVIVSVSKSF